MFSYYADQLLEQLCLLLSYSITIYLKVHFAVKTIIFLHFLLTHSYIVVLHALPESPT